MGDASEHAMDDEAGDRSPAHLQEHERAARAVLAGALLGLAMRLLSR